jgi:predicted permease
VFRLRPGVMPSAATSEAGRLFRAVAAEIPSFRGDAVLDLVPLSDAAFPGFARDSSRRVMIVLFGVAICVLLVACANVANLLLVSGERRRLEWGVRLSLGVTRSRLAGQLLAETLFLVVVSTGVALLLARWTMAALSGVPLTANVPIRLAGVVDLQVALAAVAVAGVTTLGCGLAPAWHGARTDVVSLLGRGTAVLPRSRGAALRDLLVATQVGASVLLVVAAILFVTTLRNQQALPAGFRPEGIAMVRVNVRLAGYNASSGAEFYRRLEQRARSLPKVTSLSRALNEPLGATAYVRTIGLPGDRASLRQVMNTVVAPGYFEVLGIPIVAGRDLDATAPEGAVIVNETLARQLWPGRNAVGEAIEAGDRGSRLSRVIGVVRDSKYHSLQEERTAFVYTHAADDYDPTQVIFARTSGDAAALLPALRRAVHDVDPRVPILTLTTLRDHVASTLSQPRAAAGLVTTLAALAAVLAAVGLHAVLAFIASTRRRELAVRLALGARPWHLVAALAGRSGLAVASGLAGGIAGSLALERFASSLLYGVSLSDWWVLASAAFFAAALALAAAVGPAARAITIAPASALRE